LSKTVFDCFEWCRQVKQVCSEGFSEEFVMLLPILAIGSAAFILYRLVTANKEEPTSPGLLPVFQTGLASWYGPGLIGNKTANGETFTSQDFTAAHKTLKFNTLVEVRRVDTGASVVVRINDRGPFVADRIIDLSSVAADAIDLKGPGTAMVQLRIVPR
jgi:rare lipoprotein A